MEKDLLIIIPLQSLANSLKKSIITILPSLGVKAYPTSSGKIDTISIIENIEKIKGYKLIILSSSLSNSQGKEEGLKLLNLLQKKMKETIFLVLVLSSKDKKELRVSPNISFSWPPFDLRSFLIKVINLTSIKDNKSDGGV